MLTNGQRRHRLDRSARFLAAETALGVEGGVLIILSMYFKLVCLVIKPPSPRTAIMSPRRRQAGRINTWGNPK